MICFSFIHFVVTTTSVIAGYAKIYHLPSSDQHCDSWTPGTWFNSLAPARCDRDFKNVISEYILRFKFMSTFCEIAPRQMPQNTFEDKWTTVQVMAWCRQATSHYLSQCWHIYILPMASLDQNELAMFAYTALDSFHTWHKWMLLWEGVCCE